MRVDAVASPVEVLEELGEGTADAAVLLRDQGLYLAEILGMDDVRSLGLPTVYGIVMQARRRISVERAPGEGTTFHVDLLAANGAAVSITHQTWPAPAAPAEPLPRRRRALH